LYKYVTL